MVLTMARFLIAPILLCILETGVCTVGSCGENWVKYESKVSKFSILRPAIWHSSGDNTKGLDIVSFRVSQAVHGVFIPKSGAEIAVGRAPARIETLDQWINEDHGDDLALSRRIVEQFSKQTGGCVNLVEVSFLSEVGPGAFFVHTGFYCSTESGLFNILLTNWKGNPDQDHLRGTALKMALSLRSW